MLKFRIISALLLIGASSVSAGGIPTGYQRIANEYLIPPHLLYAIALTESGLSLRQKTHRPWPWTLNVAGTPRRYANRKAAFHALAYYLSQGIRSIDIGLMQVNWRYHNKKLGNPWLALDPYHNLRIGAQILRNAYRESRQWDRAIGRYHSPGKTPVQQRRAKHYLNRVMHHANPLNDNS